MNHDCTCHTTGATSTIVENEFNENSETLSSTQCIDNMSSTPLHNNECIVGVTEVNISIITTCPSGPSTFERETIVSMEDVDVILPELCVEKNSIHSNTSNAHESQKNKGRESILFPDIQGRRFANMKHFIPKIMNLAKHSAICDIDCIELLHETQDGYCSTFCFRCNYCDLKMYISTEDKNDTTTMDINTAIVSGAMSCGGGLALMNEFAASLNMPSMSSSTYQRKREKINDALLTAATKSMREAVDEEIKLAIEAGDVTVNNTPLITVICDGAWAKRSYRVNFSSLSGVVSYSLFQ